MKQGYTHIAVVLDNSGSMGIIKKQTIEGFNTFLKAQKEAEGEATITLAEFPTNPDMGNIVQPITPWQPNVLIGGVLNDGRKSASPVQIKVDYEFMPVKAAPFLTDETYLPQTMTPLLDTIGELMARTGKSLAALPESLRPEKVLFVIITDGEENASKVYSYDKVQELIKHQKIVYKWEFMYLGANQDAIKVGSRMGISAQTSMTYNAADDKALGSTYGLLATKTASYRSAVADASVLAFNDDERKSAMGDDNG